MTRSSRPAEQLPLQLSIEASVTLADQAETWKAYARELEAKLDSATQAQAPLEAKLDGLKKDKKAWERSYKRLKAERDQIYQARLGDADHPLHLECQQLREEVDSLRSKLYQRVWQELEAMRSPGCLGKADLTKLLALARRCAHVF